jgi:hypothetical protein
MIIVKVGKMDIVKDGEKLKVNIPYVQLLHYVQLLNLIKEDIKEVIIEGLKEE